MGLLSRLKPKLSRLMSKLSPLKPKKRKMIALRPQTRTTLLAKHMLPLFLKKKLPSRLKKLPLRLKKLPSKRLKEVVPPSASSSPASPSSSASVVEPPGTSSTRNPLRNSMMSTAPWLTKPENAHERECPPRYLKDRNVIN